MLAAEWESQNTIAPHLSFTISCIILEHTRSLAISFFFLRSYFFFFIWERECKWDRGRETGRESQADSILIIEPNAGLDHKTLRSLPKPKPRAWHATQAPLHLWYFWTMRSYYLIKLGKIAVWSSIHWRACKNQRVSFLNITFPEHTSGHAVKSLPSLEPVARRPWSTLYHSSPFSRCFSAKHLLVTATDYSQKNQETVPWAFFSLLSVPGHLFGYGGGKVHGYKTRCLCPHTDC